MTVNGQLKQTRNNKDRRKRHTPGVKGDNIPLAGGAGDRVKQASEVLLPVLKILSLSKKGITLRESRGMISPLQGVRGTESPGEQSKTNEAGEDF